ncbi:MAG TPA: carbohydrate binding domain-containing protein, partial [Bacilli bacterium]
ITYLGVKEYGDAEVNVISTSIGYTQKTITFKTGHDSTSAKIYLYRPGSTIGSAYVDDITLNTTSAAAPRPAPYPNKTTNSGFETGDLTGWSGYGVRTITNNGYLSTYRVQLDPNSAVEQIITGLLPDTEYFLSGWVISGNQGDPVYLGVKDHGGLEQNAGYGWNAWKQLVVHFKTGSTNTSAKVYGYRPPNATASPGYVDMIELRQAQ